MIYFYFIVNVLYNYCNRRFQRITINGRQRSYAYFVRKTARKTGKDLHVNAYSIVNTHTELGDHVNFNGMSIFGEGNVSIGNYFHSGKGCVMLTSYHNYDNGTAIPYDSTYYSKDIVIEDNVWLGNNVTILGGVRIGEGAIIQVGSVVVSDIPPLSIAGGHPAKVYKYRNIDHYNKLKREGRFL
jgi:acetyltransferase-like isoleucine patch superfamily enzyme